MATTEEFLISLGIDPKSIQTIVDQYQALRNRIEGDPIQLKVETNAAGVVTDVGAAAQEAFISADQSAAQFEDGIRDVEKGLKDLLPSIIAISGAAALVAGLGFGEAAEESRSLARANVILDETTEELGEKQEELRKIADETGLTYAQVAAALFDVASAGFEGDKAVAAIRASAQAAVPAGIELATAFNAIATAQTNFGISSEEAGDKLVRIADLTRGTVANVSAALGRIAPTASSVGISLDEVGAAFATITNKGESAEEASTLLFNAINKFLAPAEEAAKQLNRIGVATGDAAFQNQSLAEKLELVSDASQRGVLELGKVFDIRAGRAIRAIVSDMDKFRENMVQVADATGRTREGLETFFQSAGPQWDRFRTQVINLATAIGQDLLESLTPLVALVGDFIQENQDLFKLLTELALAVGALAAAWVAYFVVTKQIAAAGLVIQGVSKAIRSGLLLETGALSAATTAWWAKLTAMLANAKAGIARVIGAISAVVAIETGAVWASVEAWAAKIALGLANIFGKVVAAIQKVIAVVVLETRALWANTVATKVNAAAQTTLRGRMNSLLGVFGKSVSKVSALGVAAGVAASVFIGWKLGNLINDFFELEKATAKYVKTGERSWKTALVNAVTFGQLERDAARVTVELRKLNTMTEAQAEVLRDDANALFLYLEFLEGGLDHIDAFTNAVGGLSFELRGLNQIQEEGGKLTTDQLLRQQTLLALIAKQERERVTTMGLIRSQAQALKRAQETITSTQDEWTEAVKRTEEQYRLLRRAELAESVIDIEKFQAGFATVQARLAAFTTQLASAEAEREQLLTESGKGVEKLLADNAVLIAEKIRAINEIYDTLDKDIVIINDRIISNGRKFIQRLNSQADAEIDAYRRGVDGTLKEQERLLTETKKLFDKLTGERDKAAAAAERFVTRLEQAAIRRRDPALLEIIRLEKEYTAIIKEGIPDQETRARAVAALTAELGRLAKATSDEVRTREELKRVERELAEAREAEDPRATERETELVERQKTLTEELARAETNRNERREKAEGILKTAVEASNEALKTFEERNDDIAEAKEKQLAIEKNLKTIADSIEQVQAKVRDRLKEQVEQAKEVVKQQLEAVKAASAFAREIEKARGTDPQAVAARLQEFQEELRKQFADIQEVGIDQIAQGVQDASADLETLAGESGAVVDWLTTLKGNLEPTSAAIIADTKVIVPLATSVTETFNDVQGSFLPSTDALRDLAESANEFGPAVEKFAGETVEQLGSVNTVLVETTGRLNTLEEQLARLAPSGGGGNGLPQ